METSTEESLKITNEIMQSVIPLFKFEGDLNQMKIQIHPIIANGMYHRDKKLLEKERFETLITLARTLDNTNIEAVVKALGYQLTVKDKIG
jgi:hypothetical protein